MSLQQRVIDEFKRRYQQTPLFVVRAPGRVNLIGEHTDYNDGFVLPMAIDRAACIALRLRTDRRVKVHSLDMDETAEFALEGLAHEGKGWAEYIKGVAFILQEAGYRLHGWEGVMAGDVPIGSGLSSSAALELATCRAFSMSSALPWEAVKMAQLSQQVEHKWIGVKCGIMDQLISAAGKAGHALLIDCRSLETQAVPLPEGTAVIVLDTATRRGLVDSAYNERREQCEAAARFFDVPALRDVTFAIFESRSSGLDALTARRARHIITENERTVKAAEVMRRGEAKALGELMNASHASLRDDFEVSSKELNIMVEIAQKQPGCYGARMTGAGFGGCAVALVTAEAAQDFTAQVAAEYQQATALDPQVYICAATNGAEVVQMWGG